MRKVRIFNVRLFEELSSRRLFRLLAYVTMSCGDGQAKGVARSFEEQKFVLAVDDKDSRRLVPVFLGLIEPPRHLWVDNECPGVVLLAVTAVIRQSFTGHYRLYVFVTAVQAVRVNIGIRGWCERDLHRFSSFRSAMARTFGGTLPSSSVLSVPQTEHVT